jgi:hypothetical protein
MYFFASGVACRAQSINASSSATGARRGSTRAGQSKVTPLVCLAPRQAASSEQKYRDCEASFIE